MVGFDGQVVVVTGAGRGLGAAYSRLLGASGADVVVHDAGVERDGTGGDPGPATGVAEAIVDAGGRAEAQTQDLSDRAGCEDLVAQVLNRHGRIDALVHNAGIVRYHAIEETPSDEWQRMLAVNVEAAWWLCRAVWPVMRSRSYGRIVLTTSGFAVRPVPGADVTAYSVGKAAQVGLMNGLAAEGEAHGVLVNCIEPVAATRIFRREVGPGELTPESVAPAVVALASPACGWSGRVLVAQGGEFAFDTMHRTAFHDLGAAASPDDVLTLDPSG